MTTCTNECGKTMTGGDKDSNGNEFTKAWGRGRGGEWGGENDDGKQGDGEVGGEMRMMTGWGGSDAKESGAGRCKRGWGGAM